MTRTLRIADDHLHTETLLGIDIGSVTISLVRMDLSGRILDTAYLFHKGRIRECLRSAGEGMDLAAVRGIAVCADPRFDPKSVTSFNPQVAAHPGCKSSVQRGKVGPACWCREIHADPV